MKILKMIPARLLMMAGLLALPLPVANGAPDEADLIAILESGAAAVQKCEACQKLRLVGTARAVPALAALLNDERVSQAARFALEALPGPEADAALREALDRTAGLLQAGVADSLGWRGDAAAVPLLAPLLTNSDAAVAQAAATALGRIGTAQALEALLASRPRIGAAARPALLEALLRCAERLLAEGRTAQAQVLYESLAQPDEPDAVRVAAHCGLIRCAGGDALARIQSALRGTDAAAQVAALQMAGEVQHPQATARFAGLLPQVPPTVQVALLALLRTRGDPAAFPAVQAAAGSPDPAVRTAALGALGELGDASTVPFLAEAAASREAAEQRAARQALESLHRGDMGGALVARLAGASPAVQAELVRALTTRQEKAAVPALLELARGRRPAERDSALRALESLADPSHGAALAELLAAAPETETRAAVVSIFEAIAERAPGGEGLDSDALVRRIATGDLETRKALLGVCARFVNEPLREALRAALKDANEDIRSAAGRALCDARDPDLLPDLLSLARRTSDASLRSLALAGIVRLATDEAAATPLEKRAEMLAAAFELAGRVEDKRRVLSGLGRVPHPAMLALAQNAAEDPAVKAEASAARAQILQKLGFNGPFIQEWVVSGPYRKEGVVGALAVFNIPFDPEEPDAPVRWQGVPPGEHVNLAALFPGQENCAAYLKAQVIAPAAVDALLLLGTDDGVKAWLDGRLIHANNVDRGEVVDQDQVAIRLQEGTNTLLLKITQGGGGWSARARIVGADGQPLAGLQVVPQNAPPVQVQAPQPPPVPKPAILPPRDHFRKLRLTDQFYAEGAYFGDFNRDGRLDVVAGPFWFEGPDFNTRHAYRPVKEFDPKTEYSDNFLTYAGDCNGDGWPDIICVPYPGREGYWYANPAGKGGEWKPHLYYPMVGNESPLWSDVTGDGRPELIFCNEGFLGFAGPDFSRPEAPWVFHPVSHQDKRYQRFTHGVGVGDINGDGRGDVVEAAGWWGQPAQASQPWSFHPFQFAQAAAQMLVYDVNGDGLADLVTAWHCHEYGLVWWEQVRSDGPAPDWRQHVILPPQPEVDSEAFRVSQLHAFDLADMNGDGLKDVVTGKRFWAHGPQGDPEPDAPAVVFWLELRREPGGQARFIPHLIDDDSGVGTQVATADLNGDGRPDVIVSNKKGIFVHLSEGAAPRAQSP